MRLTTFRLVVAFAVMALVGRTFTAPAQGAGTEPWKLSGKWKYQSFRPEPVSTTTEYKDLVFPKWSPPGIVTVNDDGKTGKLVFNLPAPKPPLELALTFTISDKIPPSVAISAVKEFDLPGGKKFKFTNELVGWPVPSDLSKPIGTDNPVVIRGSIVQTSPSLPTDPSVTPPPPAIPAFTTGFFVLEPVK